MNVFAYKRSIYTNYKSTVYVHTCYSFQVIECDLHLTEGLQVGRLEVKAGVGGVGGDGVLLNGVDLSEVARRAVRRDGGTYVLQGRKVFTAGFSTYSLRTGEPPCTSTLNFKVYKEGKLVFVIFIVCLGGNSIR